MFSSHRRIRPIANSNEKNVPIENSTICRVSLPIESKYFGLIIGAKGVTIEQIKNDTKATITLPKPNETGPIEISGESQACVDAARSQIESIVELEQYRTRVSHLINIRITDESIKNNFEIFMREVLADGSVDGLTETMFKRPANLHVTFDTMTLSNENDLVRATQALNGCVEKVMIPVKNEFGRIDVKISGARVFEEVDPKYAKTVFAAVESAALQKIADGMKEYFVAEGLSKRSPNYSGVKMHMTLIKTFIALEQSEADADRDGIPTWRRPTPRKYLDVRPILAKYANYEFGTHEITEISLSSIEKKDSDGYYTIIASVTF